MRQETHLSRPTLVLNAAWNPITIASVRHAICKVTSGLAKFLDTESYVTYDFWEWAELDVPEGQTGISMARGRHLRLPEVIVLEKFDKFPQRSVKLTRRNLLIRDGFRCQYTGKRVSGRDATLDHVVPTSKGGTHTWDNLVIASLSANSKKADKTLEQAGMKLLKKPVEPKWSPVYSKFSRVSLKGSHPDSWTKFLPQERLWHPEDYWDVELSR